MKVPVLLLAGGLLAGCKPAPPPPLPAPSPLPTATPAVPSTEAGPVATPGETNRDKALLAPPPGSTDSQLPPGEMPTPP